MKIAVTSQNKKTITGHAGRCRKFWIYEFNDNKFINKTLLELTKEQSFHESSPHDKHPLDEVDVLISGGMGAGLQNRLRSKGIEAFVTQDNDPQKAVESFIARISA